jgi:hypothetical protein
MKLKLFSEIGDFGAAALKLEKEVNSWLDQVDVVVSQSVLSIIETANILNDRCERITLAVWHRDAKKSEKPARAVRRLTSLTRPTWQSQGRQ